jgi:hypothetical protein
MWMKNYVKTVAPLLITLGTLAVSAPCLRAQVTDAINAHVNHSFMIGDKMLPPGNYTFRIDKNSDLGVMTVQNQRGDNVAQFNVRQSTDNHRPKHSELLFRKYGNMEFLSKIYEGGSKSGVAVTETSKEEARMVKEGQHGEESYEEAQ